MCKNSHRSGFDWDDLRSFLAVVRTGRLTIAALQLQMDHSTLSRRISSLEKALQVRLFDRLPTGYVLTPTGESLLIEAEEVERVTIRILSQLSEAGMKMTGSIRLATPEGFGTCFLTPRLHPFAERHPEVTVELIANPGVVSLTKRQADIAVTMARPEGGPLRARKLTDYEYGLYGSHELLSDRKDLNTTEDVEDYRLIGYIGDLLPTPAHDYLKDIFHNRRADLETSNILTQFNATVEGYGICILPCFMASTQRNLVRILPNIVNFTRTYWLVTHEEVRAPVRAHAMTTFLVDSVKESRRLFLPTAVNTI